MLLAEDIAEQKVERKHTRTDHKYSLGEPVSLGSLQHEGEWFADRIDSIEDANFFMDLNRALQSLTELQRRCLSYLA